LFTFTGKKLLARIAAKVSTRTGRRKRTILIRFLSPLLFFFPDVHLRELEKLWTDEIIVEALWRDFMQKLVSEWTDFVLYVVHDSPLSQITRVLTVVNRQSTVMLAANVAFLAIPGVIRPPSVP
jgi:hypothetical protein